MRRIKADRYTVIYRNDTVQYNETLPTVRQRWQTYIILWIDKADTTAPTIAIFMYLFYFGENGAWQ